MKMESEVRELLTEEIKDPCRQALHLRPQRPDQGI
jgi:hypothetical protein